MAAIRGAAVTVAAGWTAVGFWPILPLCGLELGLLTYGLYKVSHSLLAREVALCGPTSGSRSRPGIARSSVASSSGGPGPRCCCSRRAASGTPPGWSSAPVDAPSSAVVS
ncbi:MAG: hypothetical protein U5K43_12330 [Halofilum sp. (in: g-proteobacteria)]|nr:hypothetical protein [Halofilum sp. (in: g-proteobacteria)]